MKKRILTGIVTVVLALGCLGILGCSNDTSADTKADDTKTETTTTDTATTDTTADDDKAKAEADSKSADVDEEVEVIAGTPDGYPALLPVDHQGRLDEMDAQGCYTCHGATDAANPAVATATALPEDHYTDGSYDTQEIEERHLLCYTCHGQTA